MVGYEWHDLVGNVGVLCILGAYLLLQLDRVSSNGRGYLVANALGAALILVSLVFEFNLSAFLIESAWLLISLFGLFRRSPEAA